MKTEMLSTRTDHNTTLAFTHICESMDLSPSLALKRFVKAVINYRGIPFELTAKIPNTLTAEAIAELESSNAHEAKIPSRVLTVWKLPILKSAEDEDQYGSRINA